MKQFASELAAFIHRHYPESVTDGSYRFSADIRIVNGDVDVDIPMLTRLPDGPPPSRAKKSKSDFGITRSKD